MSYFVKRFLCIATLFTIKTAVQAQCTSTNSLPYYDAFTGSNDTNTCWILSQSNPAAQILMDEVKFEVAGGLDTVFILSPKTYLSEACNLSYSFRGAGLNSAPLGSFHVFIKRIGQPQWFSLKTHNHPLFNNRNHRKWFEEIEIPTSFIGDTVRFKFEFNKGFLTTVSQIFFDDFLVEATKKHTLTPPYIQSFDGPSWRPDSSLAILTPLLFRMDSLWSSFPTSRAETDVYKWVVNSGGTYTTNTGPASDRSGVGNYVYTEASHDSHHPAYLYTPTFDLSGTNRHLVSFWYHMYGVNVDTLFLQSLTHNGWTNLATIIGQQQISNTDPWKNFSILIDTSALGTFRFVTTGASYNGINKDIAIDDFSITPEPCAFPLHFSISHSIQSFNSVTLNWTPALDTNVYRIEYGLKGFSLGTGTTQITSGNSLAINNLQPDQTYEVYVTSICANNINTMEPYSFSTSCILSMPYLETFDDTISPSCWNILHPYNSTASTDRWRLTGTIRSDLPPYPGLGATGKTDFTGNNGYAIGIDGSAPFPLNNINLLTPYFDLNGALHPKMSFWVFSNNVDFPGNNNRLAVDLFDGTNWNINILSHQRDSSNWVQYTVYLDSFALTNPIRFRFRANKLDTPAAYYNDLLIDDFLIEDGFANACNPVFNITNTRVGCSAANIEITPLPQSNNLSLLVGSKHFEWRDSSAVKILNPTINTKLTGLSPSTSYDVYLIDSCVGSLSIYKTSFTTDSSNSITTKFSHKQRWNTDGTKTVKIYNREQYLADSCIWKFLDGVVMRGDTVERVYATNGTYMVWNYLYATCGVDSFLRTFTVTSIGLIEALSVSSVNIYPNPTSGDFIVETKDLRSATVELKLFNSMGKLVFEKVLFGANKSWKYSEISTTKLDAGVYYLKANTDNQNWQTKRIIIY